MKRKISFKWIILLLSGIVVWVSCPQPTEWEDSTPTTPSPPSAVITVTGGAVSQGSLFQTTEGEAVSFSASSSSVPFGSSIVSYDWDFADGTLESGITASHDFGASDAVYTVTLTVTDDYDNTDTDTVEILINNPPSVAITTGDVSAEIDAALTFGASCSDSDGDIVSYSWNMGDGTVTEFSLPSGESVPSMAHSFADAGSYTVTLTITDDDGTRSSASVTAEIVNPVNEAPEAVFTTNDADNRINRDVLISFDASSSTDDAPGLSYAWDFGDGTTETGVTASHSFTSGGDYTVTLNVTDAEGLSDGTPATAVISVNYRPQADFSMDAPDNGTVYMVNEAVQFTSSSNDQETGDLSYLWNFDDGTTSNLENPSHTYAGYGSYSVTLTVTDSEGDSHSDSLTLEVNGSPDADAGTDQSISDAGASTVVTLDGTSSSDPEGVLIYDWAFTALPSASSLDNSLISGSNTTSPSFPLSGESAAAQADGTLVYVLELTVTDSHGITDRDDVTVTVDGSGLVNVTIQ